MYRSELFQKTSKHQLLTYEDCSAIFAKAKNKERGKPMHYKNTLLKKEGEAFTIRLWDTDIITITPQNILILNSGGWRTKTTKDRINEFSPVYISQSNKVWYVNGEEFFDGIQVDLTGRIVNPLPETIKEVRAEKKAILDKLITQYCDGFQKMVEAGELTIPDGGDCWYCSLVTNEGVCFGDATKNDDHIIQHLRDRYFVPSLLYNAIKTKKYADPVLTFHMIQHDKNGKWARRELRYFFRKKYESLLKLV